MDDQTVEYLRRQPAQDPDNLPVYSLPVPVIVTAQDPEE